MNRLIFVLCTLSYGLCCAQVRPSPTPINWDKTSIDAAISSPYLYKTCKNDKQEHRPFEYGNEGIVPPEFILAGLCVGQIGCDKITQAYTLQHPEIQLSFDRAVDRAKAYVGPTVSNYVVPYTLPFMLMEAGQSGTIRLNKYWSVTGNLNSQIMNVNFTY
jgi:hypothetical protein